MQATGFENLPVFAADVSAKMPRAFVSAHSSVGIVRF